MNVATRAAPGCDAAAGPIVTVMPAGEADSAGEEAGGALFSGAGIAGVPAAAALVAGCAGGELPRIPFRGARGRPQVGAFTLGAEQAEHLGRPVAAAAEPVRDPGVELGGLARPQHHVLVAEHQAELAVQDVEPLVALVDP